MYIYSVYPIKFSPIGDDGGWSLRLGLTHDFFTSIWGWLESPLKNDENSRIVYGFPVIMEGVEGGPWDVHLFFGWLRMGFPLDHDTSDNLQ